MGYLDKFNPEKKGVTGKLVTKLELGAFSAGFGYVQNRYREKAAILGVPLDLAVGVLGSAVTVVGGDMYGKLPGLMPHVEQLANAGIASFFHTMGAHYGARKAGVARLLVPAADLPKAKAALPNATVVGDIPKAPRGDFLTSAQLAEMGR